MLLNETRMLEIRSWAITSKPAAVIQELFGSQAQTAKWQHVHDQWIAADAIPDDVPVGKVCAVVSFTIPPEGVPTELLVVAGSQGCPAPKSVRLPEVTPVVIQPGSSLLLDARCWYFARKAEKTDISLIVAGPITDLVTAPRWP